MYVILQYLIDTLAPLGVHGARPQSNIQMASQRANNNISKYSESPALIIFRFFRQRMCLELRISI